MSWDKEHLKYRDEISLEYAKMYNQDSKKIGSRGAFNNLRGIRQEYRENFDKYHSKIKKKLSEITPVIKIHLPGLVIKINHVYHGAMIGENRVPFVKDEILDDLNGFEPLEQDLKYLFTGIERFSEVSLHDMELSRLIGYIKNNGFPRELKFKKAVNPADERDWIRQEFSTNRENYKHQKDWAEATARKFKKTFNTPIGSPNQWLCMATRNMRV